MRITAASGATGFLPASYAPLIAQLSIESMLVQQLSMMTFGAGSVAQMRNDDVSVQVNPAKGGFELFL